MNTTTGVNIPGFVPHVVASNNDRTVFSIVWSCIATLFACAWVAVHPDVPGLDDNGLNHFFHRLRLLKWVLITPEAVLVWALRQHQGARALGEKFSRTQTQPASSSRSFYWTLSHGHFLQMGGFVICPGQDKEDHMFIATPEQLQRLSSEGIIDFPKQVKQIDIDARSKSDGLAHFLTIGQLLWFVTQCIARTAAGLSITLFELTAASFVPLTIIMHVLWWRKPQNAQAPIVIMVKPGKNLLDAEPGELKKEHLFFPFSHVHRIIQTFEDMLGTTHRSQSIPPRSRKLPSFYGYRPPEGDLSRIHKTPLIFGTLFGMLFGIIHILGWNFQFASFTERCLWRASAVAITVSPLLTVLNVFLARKRLHMETTESTEQGSDKRDSVFSEARNKNSGQAGIWGTFRRVWYAFAAIVLALGYIAARVILFGIMCSSLRKLSPQQLRNIGWVTDVPHFF